MKSVLIAGLVALLLLSGCFGKSTPTTTTSSTLSSSPTKTATSTSASPTTTASGPTTASSTPTSGTTSSGPPANRAPTAVLTASNGTGDLPFNVTFGVQGSDPDRDALNYTLAFGDGTADATGDAVPAVVSHVYTLAGNFTVRLTVRDASLSAEATLVVHAINAAKAPQVLSGDVSADCALKCDGCAPEPVGCGIVPAASGAAGCASFNGNHTGVDCQVWPVQDAAGKAFTLTSTGGDPTAEFFDKCDATMGKSLGDSRNDGAEAGIVPAGTGCIVAWESSAVDPGETSTLTFSYH